MVWVCLSQGGRLVGKEIVGGAMVPLLHLHLWPCWSICSQSSIVCIHGGDSVQTYSRPLPHFPQQGTASAFNRISGNGAMKLRFLAWPGWQSGCCKIPSPQFFAPENTRLETIYTDVASAVLHSNCRHGPHLPSLHVLMV